MCFFKDLWWVGVLLVAMVGLYYLPKHRIVGQCEALTSIEKRYHEVAALKGVCGHLVNPTVYLACSTNPQQRPAYFDCGDYALDEQRLSSWIAQARPPAVSACRADDDCREWLEEQE